MVNLQYRYQTKDHESLIKVDYFSSNSLGFKVYENVVAVPITKKGKSGGVYTKEGTLIHETSTNREYGCENLKLEPLNNNQVINKPCIFMGVYENCWGHFITDCLKKMWFLKSPLYSQYKNYDFVLISDGSSDLGNNHRQLLESIGFDFSRLIIIKENTLLKTLVIPDSCFFYDSKSIVHYTKEYYELINTVKNNYKGEKNKKYKKIYFSYSTYKKRGGFKKTFGENKLNNFFKQQGFLVVHPEKHTFLEQLEMLSSCDVFASTEGSTSHNAVFINDKATIIIIPRGPYFSGYQQTIDSMLANNIYYIDSSLSAFVSKNGPWSGPNYFYVSDELLSFFEVPNRKKKRFESKNFKDIGSYLKYCLVNLCGREYYLSNIYSEKFFKYLSQNSKHIFFWYYSKMCLTKLFRKMRILK